MEKGQSLLVLHKALVFMCACVGYLMRSLMQMVTYCDYDWRVREDAASSRESNRLKGKDLKVCTMDNSMMKCSLFCCLNFLEIVCLETQRVENWRSEGIVAR